MPTFSWSRNRDVVKHSELAKVRKELEDKYSKPESGRDFIHPDDVSAVMTRKRILVLFENMSWYTEECRDAIWPAMNKIICILITTNFSRWADFHRIFFTSGRTLPRAHFNDDNLPVTDTEAHYLPEDIRAGFLRQQYIFVPVVIQKDSHRRQHDIKMRLPILRSEAIDTSGAQGEVDRVWIEKGYLQDAAHTHNYQPKVMARKTITMKTQMGQRNSSTEIYSLEAFRKSLTTNRNIMESYASFRHGHEFVILSEWADGRDLNCFLNIPDRVLEDYPARSLRFTPHNLLTEAYSLAQALAFLHGGMTNNRGTRISCAHLDLKPENVLVFFPQNENPADYPVGQWKICDFGLANVEESIAGGRLVPTTPFSDSNMELAPGRVLRELSIKPPTRGAGPFQPPEVRDSQTAKVSTSRDVWSFGCILFMILAYAIGGPDEVRVQFQCRARGADDYFYHRVKSSVDKNPWRVEERAAIKPELITWLNEKTVGHGEWAGHWSRVVQTLLNVDFVARPSMEAAVHHIGNLLQHTNRVAPQRLWDFAESMSAPELAEVVPPVDVHVESDRNSVDSMPPYVGAPSNSSPSTSPGRNSQGIRSSPSIGTWFRRAVGHSYLRLKPPDHCHAAALCVSGTKVAFWSALCVQIYDLTGVNDASDHWLDSPRGSGLGAEHLGTAFCSSIHARSNHVLVKVVIAGRYVATVQAISKTACYVVVYVQREAGPGQQPVYEMYTQRSLSVRPQHLKLSVQGACLIKSGERLELITRQGPAPIPEKFTSVVAMDFSADGDSFCLWERDQTSHYWSVWRSSTMKILGTTISIKHTPWSDRPGDLDAYLIPFRSYPRFIACDKRGMTYLVRADQPNNRVALLGHTNRVFAGLMAPDDESFLLIRASQHARQHLQRFVLSSMNDVTSFSGHDHGRLPKDFDRDRSDIAVRTCHDTPEASCLITALPNGLLTRKIF